MLRNPQKITVCRQYRELEANAKLCQQGVDRADLKAVPSAGVSEIGGVDVVASIGNEKGQGGEAIDDRVSRSRSPEPLQEFLENEAGREDGFATSESPSQLLHLGLWVGWVPPKRERPDAGVDQPAQSAGPRDRSAL